MMAIKFGFGTAAVILLLMQTISAQNNFDWNLFKKVVQGACDDCNVILSPFSAKVLLSFLAESASEESKSHKELLSIVFPYLNTTTQIDTYLKDTFDLINKTDEEYDLSFAIQAYADERLQINDEFITMAKSKYYADVRKTNFTETEQAAKEINEFVSEQTKGHISNAVTPDKLEGVVALFLNAIYFNGKWKVPFNENDTRTRQFQVNANKSVEASFLYSIFNEYFATYSTELESQILRLDYEGDRFSMYLILPQKTDGVKSVIEKLDPFSLFLDKVQMEKSSLEVEIPKFKFDYAVQLEKVLQELGVNEIFSSNANLKRFTTDNGVQVSSVTQKSGIIVDEKGTTAYGETDIGLVNKYGGEGFKANHPFLFFIEDNKTGSILFAGKVSEPEFK